MAFQAKAVLQALETLVSGLTGVQAVYVGVPQSIGNAVSAYITLGGQNAYDKATGLRQRDLNFRIVLVYRTAGDIEAAEETIADLLDALEAALYADRTLGGVCQGIEVDFSAGNDPQYSDFAAAEYRRYPVIVTVKQQRNYP